MTGRTHAESGMRWNNHAERRCRKKTGKQRKKVFLPLIILVTVIAFFVLVVTMLFVVTVTCLLMKTGLFHFSHTGHSGLIFILLEFALASIFVGTLVSFVVGRISLRPLGRLISGMNRLAGGDYSVRLYFGERKIGKMLADSFNKMAEELDNTELLRSDFVNNFSHEFKTPIVSIYGFAKMLRRGHPDEEQTREYLTIIEQESGRLAEMATNVLNMTKVENQNILTNVTEYNLSEQIRRSVLLLEKKWSRKELEIACDFNEHQIFANEEMMKQVWLNLLDNAIKFTPEKGKITILIREYQKENDRPQGSVLVAIKNNGPAIKEEDRERIFNKFYQSDTSHASAGTGIGLAVVKKIVELHEGKVWVESDDRETTFWVNIPKREEE